MKTFKSELAQNYNTYSFGYTQYAIREKKDELSDIYEKGFLPYSGKTGVKDHLYMSRSLRVDLKKFKPNSENRRVLRKFENELERTVVPISKFDTKNTKFLTFCQKYFKEWHGIDINEKLDNVLNAGFVTDVVSYSKDSEDVAYVLLVQDKNMTHYWFSFYDLDLIRQSLGMWLMVNETVEAQKSKRKHMYIGTGYGKKAKYKINLDNVEFWDGKDWDNDKSRLKARAKTDDSRTIHISDGWKNR